MGIDEIREQLAIKISYQDIWEELLNDTNPGNHGCENVEVQLLGTDIFVDIAKKKFTFKNASFSFTARIGGTRDEDSHLFDFNKAADGDGTFDFVDKSTVEVTDIEVDVDLELFDED